MIKIFSLCFAQLRQTLQLFLSYIQRSESHVEALSRKPVMTSYLFRYISFPQTNIDFFLGTWTESLPYLFQCLQTLCANQQRVPNSTTFCCGLQLPFVIISPRYIIRLYSVAIHLLLYPPGSDKYYVFMWKSQYACSKPTCNKHQHPNCSNLLKNATVYPT